MANGMHSELEISATASEIARMSRWLKDLVTTLQIDSDTAFRLDICADEAVGNIVRYAYKTSAEEKIYIRFVVERDVYILEIEDDGAPFNPLLASIRELPKELEDAHIGGLGIRLIRNYCDQIAYRRASGKNILTFTLPRIPVVQAATF